MDIKKGLPKVAGLVAVLLWFWVGTAAAVGPEIYKCVCTSGAVSCTTGSYGVCMADFCKGIDMVNVSKSKWVMPSKCTAK